MGNPEVPVEHEDQKPVDPQVASTVDRLRGLTSEFLRNIRPWEDKAGHCPSPFPRTMDELEQ